MSVGVNTIISKMFIKSLLYNHHAAADIVEAKLLNAILFQVTVMFLQHLDSNNEVTKLTLSLNLNYTSIVLMLDELSLIMLDQSDFMMVIPHCTQPVHTTTDYILHKCTCDVDNSDSTDTGNS